MPPKTAVADDENEPKKTKSSKKDESQGLEASLWQAAEKLRSQMDAAEYKHVVLGLIFLKYVSDVFNQRRVALEALVNDPESDYFMPTDAAKRSILESRDEYTSEGVFWVPEGHRWEDLRKNAKQTDIGMRIDAAMDAIEKENDTLKGVLPKNYARRELTPTTLGGLIDTFSREDLTAEEHEGLDVLGRVFEYMVGQFASAEGKLGGEFYTPRSVVKLMVDMLEPFNGRVYDLALRGIDANLGAQWGDSFANDQHPDLRADFVIANPPFNIDEWGGENHREDPRWKYGTPPTGNANFAWIQHMLHHLAPTGTMATVLANGSLTSKTSGEGEIRKALVEADLVECIVVLPEKLFYSTGIPVCIWFLTKDKTDRAVKSERPQRKRSGEVLFIDARKLGKMVTKTVREFSDADIELIAETYHAWRGEQPSPGYTDTPGFSASVTLEQIRSSGFVLTPGTYVGTQAVEEDSELPEEKVIRLT